MSNNIYPKWKEALWNHSANSNASSGVVKVALVDTDVRGYVSTDEFYSSMSAAIVGTPQTIGAKTFVNGVFDGDNVVFPSVSGSVCEALLFFVDTGTPSTSRLIAYIDTNVTTLPVIPNGGDIIVAFNASGILAL